MQTHSFLLPLRRTAVLLTGLLAVGACQDDDGVWFATNTPTVTIPTHECGYDAQCADLSDTSACLVGACVDGSCTAKASPAWSPCSLESVGECERGACNQEGNCVAITVEDGAECQADDWDACTGYSCVSGVCTEVALALCDDLNPCTDDSCDPATGCVFTDNAADCDDLNPCTGDDVCAEGVCAGATELCTCYNDEDCVSYDDGDLCNGVMTCDMEDLVCVPLEDSEVSCEPGEDSCYDNVCNPETGGCEEVDNGTCQCQTDGDCASFEDGDLCNGTLVCDVGTSQCVVKAETVVTCPESGDACTVFTCDAATGLCDSAAAPDATPCTDNDPCTGCGDGDGGCDDGDFCDGGVCVAGAGEPCACATDDDCLALEDGDACNGTLACVASECVLDPSTLIDCSGQTPPDVCHTLVCTPATGVCDAQPIDGCTP